MWSFEDCSLNGRWVKRFWPLQSCLRDWAERVMLGHMSQEQEELSVEECENHKPPPPSRPVARLRRGSGALCFFFFFFCTGTLCLPLSGTNIHQSRSDKWLPDPDCTIITVPFSQLLQYIYDCHCRCLPSLPSCRYRLSSHDWIVEDSQ